MPNRPAKPSQTYSLTAVIEGERALLVEWRNGKLWITGFVNGVTNESYAPFSEPEAHKILPRIIHDSEQLQDLLRLFKQFD